MENRVLCEGVVRMERVGRVAVVTLNRPQVRNAVNAELASALGAALEAFCGDEELRAGVLTGAGPAFCAGQDLAALAGGEPVGLPDRPDWGFGGLVRHRVDKPLVAAVHGYAFGGGLELALACDLLVLGESARIGLPEVGLGLFAAAGGLPRIAQQVPPKIAAEWALTGAPVSAEAALRWGLANAVVPDQQVLERALAYATLIAYNGPSAVRVTKRLLRDLTPDSSWSAESWRRVDAELEAQFTTDEAREGIRAFLAKDAPAWR